MRLQLENVKCGGCARSIEKALLADARITRVSVDPAQGLVVIEAEGDVRAHAATVLAKLGYSEKGSVKAAGPGSAVSGTLAANNRNAANAKPARGLTAIKAGGGSRTSR